MLMGITYFLAVLPRSALGGSSYELVFGIILCLFGALLIDQSIRRRLAPGTSPAKHRTVLWAGAGFIAYGMIRILEFWLSR